MSARGPSGRSRERSEEAMKAYVLVETSAGKTKAVKRALQKVKPGKCKVESLDAVTGPFDYIAVVEGPTLDDIGQLVTDGIGAIDGVTRTTTCLAVAIG
jgi:DNA-binding Lrp family transcriptional regulator